MGGSGVFHAQVSLLLLLLLHLCMCMCMFMCMRKGRCIHQPDPRAVRPRPPNRRQVFLQRSGVNLLNMIVDVPGFFWTAPDHLQVRRGQLHARPARGARHLHRPGDARGCESPGAYSQLPAV
jgi:hypothetical protein